MAGKRKITVEFLGNERPLAQSATKAEARMDRFGGKMKQVGKIAALGLAAGAAVAGKAMWDMGKAAMEDAQSQAILAKALKNSAGATDAQIASTEDWITAQGKALGVADDQLRPALSTLARATGDVGKAQKLASLAMDISAGTGKDLSAVSLALAKAQNGQTAGLQRLGVNMKDANGKAVDFEEAQRRLAKQFGGSAATNAETFAGKMARLRLMFDEAKESLGAKLLPVAERFADWFVADALPALKRFSDYIKTNVVPVISEFAEKIRANLADSQGEFKRAFDNIKSTVTDFISIVKSLWATFGDTILAYAKSTWDNIKKVVGGALDVIAGIFKVFSAALKGDWSGVWDGIKQTLRGAWAIIKGLIGQGLNQIRTLMSAAWDVIGGKVRSAWNGIKSTVSNGVSALIRGVASLPGRIASAASGMFDGIKNAFRNAVNWIIDKWNGLSFTIGGGSILGQDLPSVTLGTPDIPRLARGGVVKARPGGTMALIGEAGHDEAVVPLSGPHARRDLLAGGGGNVVININGAMDPQAVAMQIEQLLAKYKRTSGKTQLAFV